METDLPAAHDAARVRALEQHETQLAAIVNSVRLAVISVDESQTIVLFNPEAEAVFRCSATQAIGESLDCFIPARARQAHRRHVAGYDGNSGEHGSRAMGGERILTGLRADGEEFPIEATISIAAVAGRKLYTVILRDVTERVRHQEELRRHADIIDCSGDAIISRTLSGTILTWNPAAERLFGYHSSEMIGSDIERLYSPNMPAAHRNLTALAMRGQAIANFETLRRRKDGTDVQVAVTLSLVHNRNGEVTGSSAIYRDITERKRLESELQRLLQEQRQSQAQLRESRDRLRELSAALQTIREEEKMHIALELHDELGQALTALKMDASAIAGELQPSQDVLRKRVEGMKQMIDATVASVRRISSDLRPVMLDNLGLAPTLEWLTREFSRRTGIHVELNMPNENLGAGGDAATAIFRITQESLTNVARHSGATTVHVDVLHGDGTVVVRVWDNGKGIDEQDLRKVRSFGLLGMRERAYVLGGSFSVGRAPQGGTLIEAVIPAFGTTQEGRTR